MNISHFKYTYYHKKAFLKVEKDLLGKNTFAGYMHDTDKLFLYLIPFLNSEDISRYHRKHAKHHLPNCLCSEKWMIQAIIDWECARITKPDKPRTAKAYIYDLNPEYIDIFQPLFDKLGLDT